jgi:ribosomal-protein-alanine N-acetyltransferase
MTPGYPQRTRAGMRLRLATPADAEAIARLSRTEIEQGLDWCWTPSRVQQALREPETNVVLAERGGVLLGFGIMRYRDDRAHLCLLAVVPAQRRRGVGLALLGWLEQVARVAGIRRLGLEARRDNAAALAFYARQGFERVEVVAGLYQGVQDGVRMRKDLSA